MHDEERFSKNDYVFNIFYLIVDRMKSSLLIGPEECRLLQKLVLEDIYCWPIYIEQFREAITKKKKKTQTKLYKMIIMDCLFIGDSSSEM